MKKGFSLVEMMVVMGIVAVLSSLGITAFINIRKQNEVDKAVEEVLTMIRESQNNSIAVKHDADANPTKVWTVYFQSSVATGAGYEPNTAKIYSWYPSGTSLEQRPTAERAVLMPSGVDLTVFNDAGVANWSGHVAYAVPFGAGNVLIGSNCRSAGNADCHWEESQKPTKEWYVRTITPTGQGYLYNASNNQAKKMRIRIAGFGFEKNIIIKASGDAYIE